MLSHTKRLASWAWLCALLLLAWKVEAEVRVERPISSQLPTIARFGQPYTWSFAQNTFVDTNSTAPLHYNATGLPSWATFEPSNRSISEFHKDHHQVPPASDQRHPNCEQPRDGKHGIHHVSAHRNDRIRPYRQQAAGTPATQRYDSGSRLNPAFGSSTAPTRLVLLSRIRRRFVHFGQPSSVSLSCFG